MVAASVEGRRLVLALRRIGGRAARRSFVVRELAEPSQGFEL
jgi:hypothetical protein